MSRISIVDLEVSYCIGLSEEERSRPQRLLVSVDMEFDFSSAAVSDRIERTINYHTLAERLLKYGEGRNWKLLERLVTNLVEMILLEFRPQEVTVEVKKFPLPQAHHVSVTLTRARS
jgi:7,8-dihydroneopterin aldolase/epimerase/oxygenase